MNVKHMKWSGWGEEDVYFDHTDKPALAPFIKKAIGLDVTAPPAPVASKDSLRLPASRMTPELRSALVGAVGEAFVTVDDMERVLHSYGKSLRDLVRLRTGDLGRPPDVVVYPANEGAVAAVTAAVVAANAVLVPFGGGTNISGSLEAPLDEERPVVSVDLGRMGKVLSVDEESGLARVQAGVLGPDLEAQLNSKGWSLGHFPDSFNHSTLGGWVATRSSGMQSDTYGDISDLTRAVRVVTPHGTVATRAVPASSTGPSVVAMVLGSEGRLGTITEVTVQVRRLPAERKVLGYFFPSWDAGVAAARELSICEAPPLFVRVSDANETMFSLATRRAGGSTVERLASAGMKAYLGRVKGFDSQRACLSFIGYEGSAHHVREQRQLVSKVVSRHGGVCLGAGPGSLYDQKKFDTPYIRDFLLDRGALADVAETAVAWSGLAKLYACVHEAAKAAFADLGAKGWAMCHLAHTYRSGACLYFTFAFRPVGARAPLEQYDAVKGALQQAFLDSGGTLSHHHAVGVEHARWLAEDISPEGVAVLGALLRGVDPGRNLNPGKVTST